MIPKGKITESIVCPHSLVLTTTETYHRWLKQNYWFVIFVP